MKTHLVPVGIVILLVVILSYSSSQVIEDSPEVKAIFMGVRNLYFNLFARNTFQKRLNRAAKLGKLQRRIHKSVPFPCNTAYSRSPTRPESVHRLRPGDIDVIAAMGDSLTAANGAFATTVPEIANDNRGVSFTGGGQGTWREYLTLPNIIKEFNPNLIGYSYKDSLGHHREAQFNVAEIYSVSEDLNYMARILVKRIKADKRVNLQKDWKLVSIMMGANDFCAHSCYKSPSEFYKMAEVHRQDLMGTLDYLRDNLPRTLVNVIAPPNLSVLRQIKGRPEICNFVGLVECPCLIGITRQKRFPEIIAKMREWEQVEREVVRDKRYRTKKDFAAVFQPFATKINVPSVISKNRNITDFSYLSADCFHLSQKGYAQGANALWNNMMEPVNQKTQGWTETFSRFLCPTEEHPYIYTNENSNISTRNTEKA